MNVMETSPSIHSLPMDFHTKTGDIVRLELIEEHLQIGRAHV
jgi:hypothetical protein